MSFVLHTSPTWAQELIPLSLGNQWMYERLMIENGEVVEKDTVVNWIDISFEVQGKEYYSLNEFGNQFLVRNTAKGQYEIDTLQRAEDGKFLEILMFRKAHKKKVLEYQTFGTDKVKVFPQDQTESISSIQGDFLCIKYEIYPAEIAERKITTFIHPGLGIVHQEWLQKDRKVVHKLIDYRVR
ncbi:MAG: hypothetical protein AAF696_07930 [Bacteroidota bacterium]